MKVLLLATLVSQVVGRPQQADYQPGNVWSYTRPAQPTQWSTWSSVGSAAPTPSDSYHPYNSYNPYNSYDVDPYVLGGNNQPYQQTGDSVNMVSGSVGGPLVQDIGLNIQGSLPNMEATRGYIGDPQIPNNVEVSIGEISSDLYRT